MLRARSLPPPGAAEPCSLVSHMLSATDVFPDMTPAHQRHTPTGDSHFSDTEDGGSDDDAASRFSGTNSLLATPIATPLQGGRPERSGLFFLNY